MAEEECHTPQLRAGSPSNKDVSARPLPGSAETGVQRGVAVGFGSCSHLENLICSNMSHLVGAGELLIPAVYKCVDGAVHAI